ncbi:MAG: hypothetical protein HYY93_02270, partial [Planctomycetes bacterium]|nr:hypothetical protein [Planctomycetota bacterium]
TQHGDPLISSDNAIALLEMADAIDTSVQMSSDTSTQMIDFIATAATDRDAMLYAHSLAAAAIDTSRISAQADIQAARGTAQQKLQEYEEGLKRDMEKLHSKYLSLEQKLTLKNQGREDAIRRQDEARKVIDAKEKRLAYLAKQVHAGRGAPGTRISSGGPPSPRMEKLREQISTLTAEQADLYLRLTPDHPEIRALERRIERIQEDLAAAEREAAGASVSELQLQLADERDALRAAAEREQTLVKEINDIENEELNYRRLKQSIARNEEGVRQMNTDIERFNSILSLTTGYVEASEWPSAAIQTGRGSQRFIPFWTLLAFIVSLGIAYLREYFDTAVMSEYDIRRHLNLPVLAVVPLESDERILLTDLALRHPLAEVFNTAATLIRSAMVEASFKSFLVGSAVAKEGKTSVSVDLAIAMARKGLDVILVDGDLRIPAVHSLLHLENTRGITTVLEARLAKTKPGEATPHWPDDPECDVRKYIQNTGIENLRAITSGPSPKSTVRLIESQAMKDLIAELEGECDFLIFDTAPICTVGDTLMLATMVDACILVVGAGLAEQKDISWTKHLLDNVSASVLGVILNRATQGKGSEYYYYYSEDRKSIRFPLLPLYPFSSSSSVSVLLFFLCVRPPRLRASARTPPRLSFDSPSFFFCFSEPSPPRPVQVGDGRPFKPLTTGA